ncbi:hypothetical protein PROFUN_03999 [Planoprotostelium fungivorum]|uniref:Uncharacterized protein n=1 Tax=Planoprotostelium fungivorum TaxID=1890364 RepID=A0A2P6NW66_9EUKA|nr:hypothetical protein PROFUN_03999 [Planoprotostelium fungivorum]
MDLFSYDSGLEAVADWVEERWQEELHCTRTLKEFPLRLSIPVHIPVSLSHEFELLEPFRPLQRKSYDNENRFLSPKPVVQLKQTSKLLGKITTCNITVLLLDERNSPLDQQEQACMSRPCDDEAVITTPRLRTSPMMIRISHRLEATKIALCFIVDYELEHGGRLRCVITSNCFNFVRNRRRSKRMTVHGK